MQLKTSVYRLYAKMTAVLIFFVYIQIRLTSLVLELNFQNNILPQTRLVGLIWMQTKEY